MTVTLDEKDLNIIRKCLIDAELWLDGLIEAYGRDEKEEVVRRNTRRIEEIKELRKKLGFPVENEFYTSIKDNSGEPIGLAELMNPGKKNFIV